MTTSIANVFSDLFETPDLYASEIDPSRRVMTFRRMTRTTYSQSAFLDFRTVSADGAPWKVSLHSVARALRASNSVRRPLRIIFHTALCGSTLLCRCLDYPGLCLPYKEPFLLHQLSFERRFNTRPDARADQDTLCEVSCGLLSRTYYETEVPIIKPSDSCINIACELLNYHAASSALLLYQDVDQFLVAMLKKKSRREYCRSMVSRARADLKYLGLLGDVEYESLTDAQAIGYVWLGIVYHYLDLLADERLKVRSLNASTLYQHPRDTITALATFFEIPFDMSIVDKIIASGVLGQDAKDPSRPFDSSSYTQETERLTETLAGEVQEGVAWVRTVSHARPVPNPLPRPLFSS